LNEAVKKVVRNKVFFFLAFGAYAWSFGQPDSVSIFLGKLSSAVKNIHKDMDDSTLKTSGKGIFYEAMRFVNRKIQQDQFDPVGYYQKAEVYRYGEEFDIPGEYDSTIACYKKAIELRFSYFEPHYGLATFLGDRPDIRVLGESIREYRSAVSIDSVKARAYCHFGMAFTYSIMNKMGLAELELEEHKRWNPKDTTVKAFEKILEIRKGKR
jgi:hypothetical protein